MNVNLKKIKKSLFVTLVVASASTFCVFPKTNSKYYTFNDSHLVYNVKYKQLDKKTISLINDNRTSNAPKTLGLIGSFYRSNYVMSTDENVKYTFTVDSACTINSTNVSSTMATFTSNGNKATLEFKKAYVEEFLDKEIKVNYTCNADDIHINDYLQSTFNVKEQFRSKGSTSYENIIYDLGSKTFKYSYDSFYVPPKLVPYIEDGVLYIPKTYEDSSYTYIKNNYLSSAEEINYFNSVYREDNSNITTDGLLKGLSVSSNDKYYIYIKSRNFESYAYTYLDKDKAGYFWFKDKTATLDEYLSLFGEYLDMYTSYTVQQKTDLIDYIRNYKVSFVDLLNCTDDSLIIRGLYHGGKRQIKIEDTIWLYVYPPTSLEIKYSESVMPGLATIISGGQFDATFSDISEVNRKSIRSAIISKLLAKPSVETYTYLGPYTDGSQTVVALVHSVPTGDAETSIHYIEIYEVNPDTVYALSFNPGATDADTVASINTILAPFNFSITESMLNDDTSTVISKDANGIITVTFKTEVQQVETQQVDGYSSTRIVEQTEINTQENQVN